MSTIPRGRWMASAMNYRPGKPARPERDLSSRPVCSAPSSVSGPVPIKCGFRSINEVHMVSRPGLPQPSVGTV